MTATTCGFKAFDIHELLCHLVARDLGHYAAEGLDVRLADVALTPDEDLPARNYFQVACGSAFASRRSGYPFKVVFCSVDRPLFWLVGAPGLNSIEELVGGAILTYPPIAPPHSLLRAALRSRGIDPDRDVELRPARDDLIRLGLLGESNVRAGLVSSAIAPGAVEGLGLRILLFLGDAVRFVSSGIAVPEQALVEESELVGAAVRAHRRSLESIHEDSEQVAQVVGRTLRIPPTDAGDYVRRLRPCYTDSGRPRIDDLDAALAIVDRELPPAHAVRTADFYDFSFLGV